MRPRTILFCALAAVAAAVCMRFGFWQLGRLHERQARNAAVVAAQHGPPVAVATLPRDSSARYRPAVVTGRLDYAHELVLAGRTHQGSPGAELVTPLRIAGSDTAVLVNRGWVYSPNAATVDRARWHEGDSVTITGYVNLYVGDTAVTRSTLDPRIVRRLSRAEIASRIPYPVAPWYLVQTGDSADGRHPARRTIPVLDDGPHRGYAVQWFSFALIAMVGALFVVLRERDTTGQQSIPGRQAAGD
jgi:surfeit locus 1 family protein